MKEKKGFGKKLGIVVAVLAAIIVIGNSFAIIPTGYTGVRVTFGQISNAVVPNGMFGTVSGSFKNVTLSNFKLGNSLMDNTTSTGVVKGVALDAGCTVDFPQPEDAANFGGIVGTNLGSVEDCSSAAKVELKFAALPKATEIWGGIVGYTEGVVKNCSNTGEFSISVEAPASGAYHWVGGVVGQYKGEAGNSLVIGCTNKGIRI